MNIIEDLELVFTDAVKALNTGAFAEAEKGFQQILSVNMAEPEVLRQYAILKAEGQHSFEEALELINLAIAYDPLHGGAYVTLNAILGQLNKLHEAGQAIRRAIELSPFMPAARWNYSLQLLKEGNLIEGWKQYKWGHCFLKRRIRTLQPAWDGVTVPRNLYVWNEQGSGDTVMFSRFLKPLKQRYPDTHIVFEMQRDLLPLLHHVEGADAVVGQPLDGDITFPFDEHVALLDLPGILGINDLSQLAAEPWFKVDPGLQQAAEQFMQSNCHGKPKIGLVWNGNAAHANDWARSMTFPATLIDDEHAWYLLQKDNNLNLKASSLVNLGPALSTWATTASLVQQLDLLITVDTAVAHVAGALGVPTWLVLPSAGEWRWFDEQFQPGTSTKSPWYPSFTIYRQEKLGDWEGVISKIKDDLRTFRIPSQSDSSAGDTKTLADAIRAGEVATTSYLPGNGKLEGVLISVDS